MAERVDLSDGDRQSDTMGRILTPARGSKVASRSEVG